MAGVTAPARCVHCREQPIEDRWRPFCSERCKLADLGRWLSGDYRIPGGPADEPAEDPDASDDVT